MPVFGRTVSAAFSRNIGQNTDFASIMCADWCNSYRSHFGSRYHIVACYPQPLFVPGSNPGADNFWWPALNPGPKPKTLVNPKPWQTLNPGLKPWHETLARNPSQTKELAAP